MYLSKFHETHYEILCIVATDLVYHNIYVVILAVLETGAFKIDYNRCIGNGGTSVLLDCYLSKALWFMVLSVYLKVNTTKSSQGFIERGYMYVCILCVLVVPRFEQKLKYINECKYKFIIYNFTKVPEVRDVLCRAERGADGYIEARRPLFAAFCELPKMAKIYLFP
jgi:hypothetical protein